MAQRSYWTVDEVEAVYYDMARGMSTKAACRKHKIPRSTFISYKTGRRPIGQRPGPNPYLTNAEEEGLVEWCNCMAERGFPLKAVNVLNIVGRTVQRDPKRRQFKKGLPTRAWLRRFVGRHEVVIRKDTSRSKNSTAPEYPENMQDVEDEFKSFIDSIYGESSESGEIPQSNGSEDLKENITEEKSQQKLDSSVPDQPETSKCEPPSTSIMLPVSIQSSCQIKKEEFDEPETKHLEMLESLSQIKVDLFSESVSEQIRAVLSRSNRKKQDRLKLKVIDFMETLCDFEEEM